MWVRVATDSTNYLFRGIRGNKSSHYIHGARGSTRPGAPVSNNPGSHHPLARSRRQAASTSSPGSRRSKSDAVRPSIRVSHRAILDSLDLPIAVIDSQGKVISVNRAWTESGSLTAFLGDSPVGTGFDYLELCRQAAAAGCGVAADALKGILGVCSGSIPSYELQYPSTSENPERWFAMTVTAFRADQSGAVIVQRDISTLKQAELKMRDTEQRLELITDRVPALIWMTAPDGRCLYVNKQWLDFTGRQLDQELGNGWIDRIHPDDRGKYLSTCEEALVRRQGFTLEHRLKRADGGFRWMLNTGVPILLDTGKFAGYIGSCFDISEHRATEQTLADLGGQLIDAQEEERSRVAWELHDDLSQKMALLCTDTEQLAQLASPAVAEVSAGLREVVARIGELSSDIHRLAYELHPSKLDRLGLAAASMSLCRALSEQQGMHIECIFVNIPKSLPCRISLCLYRIIQESLRNVIEHSGASSATVELCGSAEEIRLSIADRGVGFDPESIRRKGGLGFLSMRERLRLVGGSISIKSQPTYGTRIDVTVPLRVPVSAAANAGVS